MSMTNGDTNAPQLVPPVATGTASGSASSSPLPTKPLLNLQGSVLDAFASARSNEERLANIAGEQREHRMLLNSLSVSAK